MFMAEGRVPDFQVEGRVICHGKSYAGAKLYLMEKDLSKFWDIPLRTHFSGP